MTKVSGAIASKNGITLFFPTGQSAVYGQDSWRTGDLLKAVLLPLAQAGGEPIEVDLEEFNLAKVVEAATGGAMKVEEKVEDGVSKMALTTAAGARLENAQTLAVHIERAAYEGSPGLAAFLERFAKVDHKDTAQEVLRFMEKVDLPLADDGCLVLYKFLDAAADEGYYVDHHTGKVRQRIGSRVYMDVKDYQDSRASCGVGLHVCAKDYGQYGNRILLVKVRPEDVVAIPHHESSKMRVLAYHIVAALDEDAHKAVSAKSSALSAKGTKGIVAEIVAGQHIGVIEEVLVGKQGEHTVKVLEKVEVTAKRGKVRPIKGKPKPIDPKAVKKAIKDARKVVDAVQETGTVPVPELVAGAMVKIDGAGKPVPVKSVDGGTAFVNGAWVSVGRLTVVAPPSPAVEPEPEGTEPWQLARPGDLVRVVGSEKITDGLYEVDRVSNDGRASRVRVKCPAYGTLGIPNTLIKELVKKAPADAPAVVTATPSPAKQKATVAAAPRIKEGRKAEAPVATITDEYRAKLNKAQEMLNAGATLRQIDKALKMCRKSLARHIALGNLKAV
ncbi:hypothetical protein [Methylorubrum extorquens]|uniref:hypothetical protein n=1 Tax=Methylorubrum extorquens TaxID=408 RepID=UPI00209DA5CB|nr:hypothetical protein [Methylorubrum extorquens]MCP1539981.1 hypothetical protein [Methylorubrum extorquens]